MLLRTLYIVLTSRLRGLLPILATSVLRMRVMPGDLDSNLHMNNGRYFSVADLGRFDHGLRSNLWRRALRRGWRPVAGDANGRFSVSLRPFQRFELHTRLLGWDAKWFFVEHRYLLGSRVAALVVIRYLFISKKGNVPTSLVLAASGHADAAPELPDYVVQWRDAQAALVAQLKSESAVSAAR